MEVSVCSYEEAQHQIDELSTNFDRIERKLKELLQKRSAITEEFMLALSESGEHLREKIGQYSHSMELEFHQCLEQGSETVMNCNVALRGLQSSEDMISRRPSGM